MQKLFVLMGKSATGKDTLYKRLMEEKQLPFKAVTGYTTRPIRDGEQDGVDYHFVTVEKLQRMKAEGKIIECRCYHTVHGDWYYFTAQDGQINLEKDSYLMIATLEGYQKLKAFFGRDAVVPLYIEVEDGLRLTRALQREQQQSQPKYAELCRRYLADEQDFSDAKLSAAEVKYRFQNQKIEECLKLLADTIRNLIAAN